jgi:hypothetical protein
MSSINISDTKFLSQTTANAAAISSKTKQYDFVSRYEAN